MGLLDRFKRARDATPEEWKRLGRLEADVESLRLQWASYRDELRRLVNRLEKRDQRAAQREAEASQEPEAEPVVDEITAKVLARRNARGLRHLQG